MAVSTSDYTYSINGVVGTDKSVLENLDTITSACNTWMSYDSHDGLWSVVINRAGTSIASFDDSNIIGAISISGTGLEQLYNSVRVEFPHIDLNDNKDFIHDTIPSADFFPNEIYNVMSLSYDCINDPVQAEYLGLVKLKQNRLDKVVRFKTDFSQVGLKAGDLIDITSTTYGFDAKMFRIVSLTESDQDDGSIVLSITAQEYDEDVYSTEDLARYSRENSSGIATAGNVGIPGTPTVSKIEKDARPRVTIESTSPTGIVEAMEFWYTTDSYTLDENRSYQLLDTVKASSGNTFAYGTEVSITNDTLSSGNLYVKTRGINSSTIGPFSTPAGFVYTPVQTTNNIDENTTASSSTGTMIAALGALTLLNNLDQLFSGNTAAGSVFKKVFDLFQGNTGVDLLGKSSTLGNILTKGDTIPGFSTFQLSSSISTVESVYQNLTGPEYIDPSPAQEDQVMLSFNLSATARQLTFVIQPPLANMDYDVSINGTTVTRSFYAYAPSMFELYKDGSLIQQNTSDWQTGSITAQISNAAPGDYAFYAYPLLTYDLDQEGTHDIMPYNHTIQEQSSGGGLTITGYAYL